MTKQKKPKVGDTVGWYVYNMATRHIVYDGPTRKSAREVHADLKRKNKNDYWKVAKMVIDK